ncbi:MAG: alpha/beta hydrolase [Rhodoferax sp.]|nr:alpha/beta hydrolase [Rhodoferax sp.]OIP20765.1 MAG: hypothetical protein AUK52_10125 [Comamonadaceae bacterium CG2_30_60_41]PIW06912.1 MAG: lysophospholipase [Comamonadaceae bacterium CG17_big_fil_post_rev_8_21_14_2_50_60_13]PIY24598.1 MAG: lysophospholipase [Comamonadaceae bacterium CG_4_10_14_3_um_filter_60_75]PJC19236.1 MAG: lysophospholipase [Comamonadaceae bacterium CG_4_9_14_0_8_um_filter_60_18]
MPNLNLIWTPDLLPGFEQTTLTDLTAPDGPVELVLVRRRCPEPSAGKAVLYVHGFVDYFFQTHLADFYNAQGLHFYAVDLRRHGRSLRAHQLPCYTGDIAEYLEDVDACLDLLTGHEGVNWLLVNGHSTGGLVAALHAHRGRRRAAVNAVFLNSPFFDMNIPHWQKTTFQSWGASIGAFAPHLRLPGLSTVYGESLHADHHGTWRYETKWKPIEGFPVHAGWLRAIALAHAQVARGLNITCPVLLMHAERSAWPKVWCDEAMHADVVLDVADMVRLAPKLGPKVQCVSIHDGIHDLVLSAPPARAQVFANLQQWLAQITPS